MRSNCHFLPSNKNNSYGNSGTPTNLKTKSELFQKNVIYFLKNPSDPSKVAMNKEARSSSRSPYCYLIFF